MAKITLPTNYRDDILNTSAEGKRKYVMSYNQDGTVSFEDVTPYEQVGSDFGAGDINTANEAINESFDKNKLVKDLDTINALTEEGFAPDALAVKQLNESLDKVKTYVGSDGKLHFVDASGADTVLPFSSYKSGTIKNVSVKVGAWNEYSVTFDSPMSKTPQIYYKFNTSPDWELYTTNVTNNGFSFKIIGVYNNHTLDIEWCATN